MQSFDIVKETKPQKTFRVDSVIGKFDLNSEHIVENFKGELDLDFDWNIGLMVGNSGTGKSTIAKELFKDYYFNGFEYSDKAIIDDMPKEKTIDEITKMFNSVGFSSPPSWLKSYSILSNGEKMRVDLANALLRDAEMIVFDEFTSVVDRNIAKIGSYAVSKAVRKQNKKFIAVSCHFDIEDWLEADWVLNTNDMSFVKKKDKNQKSNYQFINATEIIGSYLGSIII